MENPFQAPNIVTLREAFPLVEVRVIDDALWSAKGDVNQAFELLLTMSNTDNLSPPELPVRRNNSSNAICSTSSPSARTQPRETNPFLIRGNAKPLTVREELAKWRQDLSEESRLRTINARNAASTPNLSLSNIFKLNPSRGSLPDRRPDRIHISNQQAHGSFQRVTGSASNIQHCGSIPNVDRQIRLRSSSSPLTASASSSDTTLRYPSSTASRPALPDRRQQSSNSISSTNTSFTRRPLPSIPRSGTIPATNTNHLEPNNENDVSVFNPFEEAELPPPAYSDIQKDTVIDLTP